ncbi:MULTISPECIES: gamma-glutamyl-gamma-aminobutyrate hydrolase family protein [unclassified Mumia]|uniref:gamma-glutamyl-gamma-aminobutyrate hydrolase family protein n=1 Tax=unclassified Mumia TaxID=2621872 RepID=UPI001FB86DB2|nr:MULTISPECIES: gamma-glutamyl-gamma-aminobutyrate hydrolase family protein [unclassified Mumia]
MIGLTTYLEQSATGVWDVQASFLPRIYFDAITRAGGVAVLLPPQPPDGAARVLDGLDGLVLTGGKDVDPTSYRQEPHPLTDEPRRDRDAWERALLDGALVRDLPVLGICRGAQMLNVALGGTLHQHLPDVVGHARHQLGDAVFSTTTARIVPGTRLATIVGDAVDAQCYHHQGLDRLGDGLVVSARADDGTVEAVELPSAPFVVAVQWHPEETLDDLRLFAALVDAAADRQELRV